MDGEVSGKLVVTSEDIQILLERQTEDIKEIINESIASLTSKIDSANQQNEREVRNKIELQNMEKERDEARSNCEQLRRELEDVNKKLSYLEQEVSEREVELQNQKEERVRELQEKETEFERVVSEREFLGKKLKDAEYEILKQKRLLEKAEIEAAEIRPKYDRYRECYEKMDVAYQEFLGLSSETRDRLRNVFVGGSLECFLAAGFRWENIDGLWNFVRRKIIEEDYGETDSLKKIFLFLFHFHSQQSLEPAYMLIEPELGERYDSDRHTILGNKTDGRVEEVRLEGIVNVRAKRTVYKALVEV